MSATFAGGRLVGGSREAARYDDDRCQAVAVAGGSLEMWIARPSRLRPVVPSARVSEAREWPG